MLRLLRLIFFCCGILTLFTLFGLAVIYYLAANSLPIYTQDLTSDKISQRVIISRNLYAIPYIDSNVDEDSLFALGYTHAQDRLWQMILLRRTAQGKLSEIFGRQAYESDLLKRTLNIYKLSALAGMQQTKKTMRLLNAYSDGVNSFINQISERGLGRGSPEFFLFTSKIAPWRPADSIAILKLIALRSTNKAEMEVLRTRLILEGLSKKRISDLFLEPPLVGGSNKETLSFYDSINLNNINKNQYSHQSKSLNENIFQLSGMGASNIFAVMPSRSATGTSIVASDPHGVFTSPSKFMIVKMKMSNNTVMGGTIPGIPAVLIGRNKNIGWGLSSAGIDDQDLFFEKLNKINPGEYFTDIGLSELEIRSEIIKIKGEKPVTIKIKNTRNGPILPNNIFGINNIRPKGHEISLSWTGLNQNDRSIEALMSLMSSSSLDQARNILPLLETPGQNILLADKTNIGIFTAGAVPNRSIMHSTKGKIPSLGWQKNNSWLGLQDFQKKPFVQNPPSGQVANTNNRTTNKKFPNHLSFDWADSQRILRANILLQKRQFHTLSSFKEIQNDTVSISARILIPLLAKDLWFKQNQINQTKLSKLTQDALAELSEWDGDMSQNSAAPLIYAEWVKEFQKLIMVDEIGVLFKEFKNLKPLFLERVLRNQNGAAAWCNIAQTKQLESCSEIAETALISSLTRLTEQYGSQISSWRWGNAHIAIHKSVAFRKWPILSFLSNIIHEISGGDNTIMMSRMENMHQKQYFSNFGSTMRAIFDFSSPDTGFFIVSTGQSGHLLSQHYDDQSALWRDNQYLTLKLTPDERTKSSNGKITFIPKSENPVSIE